jgi:phytoene dehydrogenase-like protein
VTHDDDTVWSRPGPSPDGVPRVLVVGGGISGLATGCYGQMSGMRTRILEKHVLPGGCCTAWSRDGYLFDYCIEWLTGTGSGNDAARIWRELGALDGKTIANFDMFNRIVGEDGREVTFYLDPDRLERHLLEISPVDARPIRAFCRDLRRFIRVNHYPFLTPPPLRTVREKLGLLRTLLPAFRLFWRTATTPMEAFCAEFQDPLLRRAFPFVFFQDHEVFPLLPYLFNLASAYHGNAGFPQGGSLGLSRSIEERYLALGGDIRYRARATRVLVDQGRAVGVELKSGEKMFADHIISACDGYTTIYGLLAGKYTNPTIETLYTETLHKPELVYPGVVSAFVGVDGDVAPGTPHSTTYLLSPQDSAELPAVQQQSLVVQLRSRYCDTFAPPGKSVIHCTYFSDFGYWKTLRAADRKEYRARKATVADFVRQFLDRHHPGLGKRIEVVDVATPATMLRYTGNFNGSILAWKSFTEAEDLATKLVTRDRMRLPGLDGFSMTGQWIGGGGLIRAASSGRFTIQYLCDELGREFRAWDSTGTEPWHPGKLGDLPQLDV